MDSEARTIKSVFKPFSMAIRGVLIILGPILSVGACLMIGELDSGENVARTILPFYMSYFSFGVGITSLEKYSFNSNEIIKYSIFFRKRQIPIREFVCYNIIENPKAFSTSYLMIINSVDGKSIKLDSFDIKNFNEIKSIVEKTIPYNPMAKANDWTPFMKVSVVLLGISFCLIFILMMI